MLFYIKKNLVKTVSPFATPSRLNDVDSVAHMRKTSCLHHHGVHDVLVLYSNHLFLVYTSNAGCRSR